MGNPQPLRALPVSRVVPAPLAAGTATCLACTWAAVWPNFQTEALKHRDETRHPIACSLEQCHAIEAADPVGNRYPRNKRGDDAIVVYAAQGAL